MVVLVRAIVMAVRMGMPRPIGMHVLVFVENDIEAPPESVSNAAERLQARNMIAPFQARDHRFRHAQARCQLLLRLAGMRA